MKRVTGLVLSISNEPAWHAPLEVASDAAGLPLLAVSPGSLPELNAGADLIVVFDERLIDDTLPLAGWKARLAAAGAPNAVVIVVTDDLAARLADGTLAASDDMAMRSSAADLERAFTKARRLLAERRARSGETPESRTRLREMVTERLSDVIFQLSGELRINYVNPAWSLHFGAGSGEPRGRSFLDFVLPEARDAIGADLRKLVSGEVANLSVDVAMVVQDGEPTWMELRALADPHAINDGSITGLLLDVSSRRETDAELRASHERYRQMALRDPLTGLSNRLVFADRLQHALEVGTRRSSGLALLFIDLDNFKEVNDTHGHSIGDRVLAAVALRFNEQVRPGDTLARYGGDEFAVILEDLNDPTQALQIADQLIDCLRAPVAIGMEQIQLGVSVGISLLSGRIVTPEEAIGEADTALYQAKAAGRGQFALFDVSLDPGKADAYRFDLRRGMQEQELNLLYLPIFDLETGAIHSVEVRIRWDHPSWGRLKPAQFLRRADASEVIGELARATFVLIGQDIDLWRKAGILVPQLRISVSFWQALDSDLVPLFAAFKAQIGSEDDQFAIELMDGSSAAERDAVKPVLDGLRSLGVAIGFDNFITGTTPLGSVVELNPAYVNLYARGHALADKGLNSRRVVEVTRAFCDAYGWEMVAKDLDEPEMVEWVRTLPIRYAQGNALAEGMSAAELATRLRSLG